MSKNKKKQKKFIVEVIIPDATTDFGDVIKVKKKTKKNYHGEIHVAIGAICPVKVRKKNCKKMKRKNV